MRLSAIILNDLCSVNNYRESEHFEMTQGDSATVYLQLRDVSVQTTFEGYKNPGRRYMPVGGTNSATAAASGRLTLQAATAITGTCDVVVAGTTFTEGTHFVAGASDLTSAIAIASAINASGAINGLVTAYVEMVSGAATVYVVAKTSGVGGNAIVTTTTAGNASWGAATLTGGAGPTPTPSLTILIDTMDDAKAVFLTKIGLQPFPNSDPSIWKFSINPTDPVAGTKRLKLKLVDASGTHSGVVNSAILVTPAD